MKRVIITIFTLAATIAAVNAQFFTAGGVGISSQNSKISGGDSSDNPSSFAFSLSPSVGYWLNDKIAVGTGTFISSSNFKNMISDPDNPDQKIEFERKNPAWGFSVFGRYKLWEKKKFSLLLTSSIGIEQSSMKEKTGTITKETLSMFSIVSVTTPLITYDLTEKFTIQTSCEFLSLVISSETSKSDTGRKVTANQCKINASPSIFSNLGNISIGFLYNF